MKIVKSDFIHFEVNEPRGGLLELVIVAHVQVHIEWLTVADTVRVENILVQRPIQADSCNKR